MNYIFGQFQEFVKEGLLARLVDDDAAVVQKVLAMSTTLVHHLDAKSLFHQLSTIILGIIRPILV